MNKRKNSTESIMLELEPKAPTTLEVKERSPTVGKIEPAEGEIEIFAERNRVTINVKNTGDRAVQVGSHLHFFEANRCLDFDREKAYGMKLDVPAGAAVRLEPGQEKEVCLVELGGKHYVWGLNHLTDGSTRTKWNKKMALKKAAELEFKGCEK